LLKFTQKEISYLFSLEEARLATCHDNIPHVKPVSYIFYQDSILVATDYETRAFQNIKKNPRVGIVIDLYQPAEHKAICIQGSVAIIEKGDEFDEIKFKWVRDDPWKEQEAPFLKIIPTNKTSWGIN
jgi:nitroimidazol reductase NimA-like FMN-containing flavoprotein (pyridoxamine 5'-phosphate oxidase superfamily)